MRSFEANSTHFRILLKKGAKVDVSDIHGRTPLYFAALANNYHDVVALVEEGNADMYKRDHKGREAPINVVKSNDIMKYFFTKMTSKDLLNFDPDMDFFDQVVERHPAVIEPFLNIFISSEGKDLDAPDNSIKYDLSLFVTGKQRKKFNMMHRHLKLIDSSNTDLLLHPIMRALTDLKWMQFLWLYAGVIISVFTFLIFFTWHGFLYVDFCQCHPINTSTFEDFGGETELDPSQCGRNRWGVIICTNTSLNVPEKIKTSVLFCENVLLDCRLACSSIVSNVCSKL